MALPSISGVPQSVDQQDHVSFSLEVPKCPCVILVVRKSSVSCVRPSPLLPRVSCFLPSLFSSENKRHETLERMKAGGDEDGAKEAPAAGAQELTGRVPQLEAAHSQPSSPHGRRSRRGYGGERGGGAGSLAGAGRRACGPIRAAVRRQWTQSGPAWRPRLLSACARDLRAPRNRAMQAQCGPRRQQGECPSFMR